MSKKDPELVIANLVGLMNATEIANAEYHGQVWWRGLDRFDWDLVSNAHRGERGPNYEHGSANRFMRRAPSRYPNCPQTNDFVAWLFLMQQHRLPTRLLDWTESPLVAMYFAMDEDKYLEEDGALVALDPYTLNLTQAQVNVVFSGSNSMPIFTRAFFDTARVDVQALAIAPEEIDIRLMTQLSAFTIHASKTPIENLDRADEFLMKFRIGADAKAGFREGLKQLGIRRSSLFPDLQHLAEELKDQEYLEITDERDITTTQMPDSTNSEPEGISIDDLGEPST